MPPLSFRCGQDFLPSRSHLRIFAIRPAMGATLRCPQHLRDAVELLERKATPEELDDYKRFVLNVADKVANAHREGGETVSADERAAIDAIAANLGTTAP